MGRPARSMRANTRGASAQSRRDGSSYPAHGTAAVSVVAPRTIDSEAWTKPFFINGRAWTAASKPKDLQVFYCDDGPTSRCAWIR